MARNGTVDRIESAANITLVVLRPEETNVTNATGSFDVDANTAEYIEIPISRLDTTKEVEMSEIRESTLKASGYSVTSISYSGTMMFKGSNATKTYVNSSGEEKEVNIVDFLYDDHGVPMPFTINVNHDMNGKTDTYYHVLASSESYEVRSEEATETAFDWVAMDRDSDKPDNN